MQTNTKTKKPLILLIVVLLILFFSPAILSAFVRILLELTWEKVGLFATIFLGIFIEALPFLLMGTLASGLVEVFIKPETIQRWMPKNRFLSVVFGSVLGLIFPVCECGVVPLIRRLIQKGFPVAAGVAFLLAAPVFNPIVILSTSAAFGWGKVLALRLGLTILIAIITGLVFSTAESPVEVLRPNLRFQFNSLPSLPVANPEGFFHTAGRVLRVALDELFEMGKFLVIGGMLAAFMQTFIPQSGMAALAKHPLLSVLVMMALAVLLSICSTVDSFVALGFVNVFPTGAILSFLVFGPMVDIKSTLMYTRVFRPRHVAYMIGITFLLNALAGILINYFLTG